MKDDVIYFLGADFITTMAYIILQTVPEFVVDGTAKMVAAIFVGFIGGFMGIVGKRVGEDWVRYRKMKKDADKKK